MELASRFVMWKLANLIIVTVINQLIRIEIIVLKDVSGALSGMEDVTLPVWLQLA
jgi:hypothetical protein